MDNLGYSADVDETPPPKYSSRRVAIAPTIVIGSADEDVDVQNDYEDDNDGAENHSMEREQSVTRFKSGIKFWQW